jgi:hypothetical protein
MIFYFLILLLALIFTVGLWVLYVKLEDSSNYGLSLAIGIINVIFDIILGIVILCMLICIPFYVSSEATVKIINAKYGTEYTAKEHFWAGTTIEKIIKTDENLLDSNNKINIDLNQ